MSMVKIIAEIGVNHNGSIDAAKTMIDAVHQCRADAVKFQTFSANRLARVDTPKVPYQERSGPDGESHIEMLRKLELSKSGHRELKQYCQEVGIDFCSTPYSAEDAVFLESIGVPFYKVASADLVDRTLHEFISSTGKDALVAVGMASMNEIEETLSIYRDAGTEDRVVLLHCVSAYPAPCDELNLRAMLTLREVFGVRVGYSDHSTGPAAAAAATALGACVIEKHFTLDKSLPGPDHAASSTPAEFEELATMIREVECALGSPTKEVMPSEEDMRRVSRKSIIAACDMEAGHRLKKEDLGFRRPGSGISPMRYMELIGKTLGQSVQNGQELAWTMVHD